MARQAQGFQRKPTPYLTSVTTSLRKDSTVLALGVIPFPQVPCNGNQEPSPRQAGLPSPYCLTARIHPFDLPNRANFDSVPIRTANYQNCGILRFDAESPSKATRGRQIPHQVSRRICRCPRPKPGAALGSWTRIGTDHPKPWLGHATRYRTRGDNGRTAGRNQHPASPASSRRCRPLLHFHSDPSPVNLNHQTAPKTCTLPGNPFRQAYPCFDTSDTGSQSDGNFAIHHRSPTVRCVNRTCPQSAVMAARQVKTNQKSTMPGFR